MEYELKLPSYRGKEVDKMLEVIDVNETHSGYTLSNELEIVICDCKIASDNFYNYHNNYDDSKNVMYCGETMKWFTLSFSKIKDIQKQHLENALIILDIEVSRIKNLKEKII